MVKGESKHYLIIIIGLSLLSLFLLLGSNKKINMKGQIISISDNERGSLVITIMKESNLDTDIEIENNDIVVTTNTLVYKGNSSSRLSYLDLEEGQIVEIVFEELEKGFEQTERRADAIRILE